MKLTRAVSITLTTSRLMGTFLTHIMVSRIHPLTNVLCYGHLFTNVYVRPLVRFLCWRYIPGTWQLRHKWLASTSCRAKKWPFDNKSTYGNLSDPGHDNCDTNDSLQRVGNLYGVNFAAVMQHDTHAKRYCIWNIAWSVKTSWKISLRERVISTSH